MAQVVKVLHDGGTKNITVQSGNRVTYFDPALGTRTRTLASGQTILVLDPDVGERMIKVP